MIWILVGVVLFLVFTVVIKIASLQEINENLSTLTYEAATSEKLDSFATNKSAKASDKTAEQSTAVQMGTPSIYSMESAPISKQSTNVKLEAAKKLAQLAKQTKRKKESQPLIKEVQRKPVKEHPWRKAVIMHEILSPPLAKRK